MHTGVIRDTHKRTVPCRIHTLHGCTLVCLVCCVILRVRESSFVIVKLFSYGAGGREGRVVRLSRCVFAIGCQVEMAGRGGARVGMLGCRVEAVARALFVVCVRPS